MDDWFQLIYHFILRIKWCSHRCQWSGDPGGCHATVGRVSDLVAFILPLSLLWCSGKEKKEDKNLSYRTMMGCNETMAENFSDIWSGLSDGKPLKAFWKEIIGVKRSTWKKLPWKLKKEPEGWKKGNWVKFMVWLVCWTLGDLWFFLQTKRAPWRNEQREKDSQDRALHTDVHHILVKTNPCVLNSSLPYCHPSTACVAVWILVVFLPAVSHEIHHIWQ